MRMLAGLLVALAAALSLRAEYLTPEQAGFRHCALIYLAKADHPAEFFKPLLVKFEDGRPTAQKGFDAYLFLSYTFASGEPAEIGKSVKADWDVIFDGFFADGRYVPSLAQAARELKLGWKPKVIVSLSWLHPEVSAFGDVDGDGRPEDLGTSRGRRAVLDWFMDRVEREMAKYPELELWGFYMMREGMRPNDLAAAHEYCDAVHDRNLLMLWIPYYNAGGLDKTRDIGFDAVILQSNWTFNTFRSGGDLRRNRLRASAARSKELGFGVELELNTGYLPAPWMRRIFMESLETGCRDGFQSAATAYYFGVAHNLAYSKDAGDQALYSMWMDYIAGKPVSAVRDNDFSIGRRTDGATVAVCNIAKPAPMVMADIFLRETPENRFKGSVQAEYMDASGEWRPLAWARRRTFIPGNREFQNISFPLPPVSASKLRLILMPDDPSSPPPPIDDVQIELECEPGENSGRAVSKAFGKPYVFQPSPDAKYPDATGRMLLDGVTAGTWSNFVGWQLSHRPLLLFFDLGFEQEVDDIRINITADEKAGIRRPEAVEAFLSNNAPVAVLSGIGAMPEWSVKSFSDFSYAGGSKMYRLKLPRGTSARFVTLQFFARGWLFVSEVAFYGGGRRISGSGIDYSFSIPPAPPGNLGTDSYPDDLAILTDGSMITASYSTGCAGFREPRSYIIDLADPQLRYSSVTCHGFGGGNSNILAPQRITASVSDDMTSWREIAKIEPDDKPGGKLEYRQMKLAFPETSGRFLKLDFTPRDGWCFLSEIAVD